MPSMGWLFTGWLLLILVDGVGCTLVGITCSGGVVLAGSAE